MMIIVLFAVILLWMFYKHWISAYKEWELRGIPFIAGSFPFGTDKEFSLLRKFQGEVIDKMYRRIVSPYFGIYFWRTSFLVIRDPDIIRLVLAKEFSHFRDRHDLEIKKDDLLSHHLFNLEGDRWRALRVKLSPTFTSGKLKGMFHLFISCAEALDTLLLTQSNSTVDVKDIFGRFTTDTITSCAFGVEANSTKSTSGGLRMIGASFFEFDIFTRIKLFLRRTFPQLGQQYQFRYVSKDIEDTIMTFIKNAVEYRSTNEVKRQDFLDLLIQLKEKGKLSDESVEEHDELHGQSVEMTIELMAAQAFVFFLAGYETSSSVQSYCLYELALHPEIQERLHNEIETTIAKHGGLTYQSIQEMEYLDMVVSETMRKYPTVAILTRRCTKPFSMPAGNRIEKGDRIFIPTWSLHRDPQFFPNPQTFDPERFSVQNKEKIKPYTYMPFGEGPRICIGMRFGLLQTKVGLITVLRKYKVSPSEKTAIPLKFKASLVVTNVEGPIYLKISKRSTTG